MAVAFRELEINRSITPVVPNLINTEKGIFKKGVGITTDYNYLSIGTTGDIFEFSFRVVLSENLSQENPYNIDTTILTDLGINSNNQLFFQPLISTNVGDYNRALTLNRGITRYNSFGFVYEAGDLTLYYIDHSVRFNQPTQDLYVYQSNTITTSGTALLTFGFDGVDYYFTVNNGAPFIILDDLNNNEPLTIDRFDPFNNISTFASLSNNNYETRHLYSNVCDMLHTVNGEIQFRYTFGDFDIKTDLGTRIDISNTIYSQDTTLELYNFSLTDIVECNTCCVVVDTPLVTSSNSELGCCFTPTVEDNIRYKINNWYLNSLGFSSIEYAEMMLKIGKSNEANAKLEKINSVHQFVFYIMSIRNRMVCENKPYTDFVSDETLNKFVEYFNCRGINIKCPLQIAMIGNFTNCCDQIEASVDCECTDEIPSAIISAPIYQYDLASEGNQTIEYTEELEYPNGVSFSCCSGNQLMEVSGTLINPHNLPVSIIPGAAQSDGTFSYDITYEYLDSVVTDIKEFYVQFIICDQTILRKHLYSAIDTCVTTPSTTPLEGFAGEIEVDINDNGQFNYIISTETLQLGDFECCHQGQRSKIINIDTSRITSSSGITINSPSIGDEDQGLINLVYTFNGENAVVNTNQRVYITYSICDDYVYTCYVNFKVVNTCTPSAAVFDPISPYSIEIDFANIPSGTYPVTIGVDFNCCYQPDTIKIVLPANGLNLHSFLNTFGVKFNGYETPVVISGNQISFSYTIDKEKYYAALVAGNELPVTPLTMKLYYVTCDSNLSTYPTNEYDIEITLVDTCVTTPGLLNIDPIFIDMYNPLSAIKTQNINTEVYCLACNGQTDIYQILSIPSGTNNAKIYLSAQTGSQYSSPALVPYIVKPYLVDIGDELDVDYPVLEASSNITYKNNCNPLGASDLVVTIFIKDNFMRADSGGGIPLGKDVIVYDFDQSNVSFLIHCTAGKSIEFNYNFSNCTVQGDMTASIFSIGLVPSSGLLSTTNPDLSLVYSAIFPNTPITNTTSTITVSAGGSIGPVSFAIAYTGFYWIKIASDGILEADALDMNFNIV